MGASLGGLASLQAEWYHPGTFGGLFLQSGSFFRKRVDDEEDFEFWDRVTTFVTPSGGRVAPHRRPHRHDVRRRRGQPDEQPPDGADAHRERARRDVLRGAGGRHDWRSWRAAFHPHLPDLLARARHG